MNNTTSFEIKMQEKIEEMVSLIHICDNVIKEMKSLNETKKTVVVEDPRVNNNSLPNDSKINFEFGARSYISDLYPGFVWRNCVWFKIRSDLKFIKMDNSKIKQKSARADTMLLHHKYNPEDNSGTMTNVDDLHDSIIVNDVRVFARRVYYTQPINGVNKFAHGYYANIYLPHRQITINHQLDIPDCILEHSYIDDALKSANFG